MGLVVDLDVVVVGQFLAVVGLVVAVFDLGFGGVVGCLVCFVFRWCGSTVGFVG